jgi:hypothetical protein
MDCMGHYQFTVFNGTTALVLALTLLLVWRRFRGSPAANWPLLRYAVMAAYTRAFRAACGVAIRLGFYPRQVRWVEAGALGYVAWRCVGLLVMR